MNSLKDPQISIAVVDFWLQNMQFNPIPIDAVKDLLSLAKENKPLREALSAVVLALGNGGNVSPECSLGFITNDVVREVRLEVAALRSEIVRLRIKKDVKEVSGDVGHYIS